MPAATRCAPRAARAGVAGGPAVSGPPRAAARWRRRRSPARDARPAGVSRGSGYLFVAGYVIALALLGIVPAAYAVHLAFTTYGGSLTTGNFAQALNNPFVLPAFAHVAELLGIWLVAMMILVVALALTVHGLASRISAGFRFLFYLPGAFAGAASVVVWLLVLDPNTSPFAFILHWFDYHQFSDTVRTGHLPFVFALMAFWTGAGGWIVIMYGALNNIPSELLEAARLDGASGFETAIHVKLPLIRRWIVYMLILCFAAGSQLFVEPQVLAEATPGYNNTGIYPGNVWSPLQVAYQQAFGQNNFNEAAAIAVALLAISLVVAVVAVWRGRLFEID
jgi:multiple sugar transport system permease protein